MELHSIKEGVESAPFVHVKGYQVWGWCSLIVTLEGTAFSVKLSSVTDMCFYHLTFHWVEAMQRRLEGVSKARKEKSTWKVSNSEDVEAGIATQDTSEERSQTSWPPGRVTFK